MVASFGRRPESTPKPDPGEQAAVTPTIQAVVIPVLSRDALADVADEIRMSIAEAVMRGFEDGMNAFRETSAEAAAPVPGDA